jgi:Putative zinc-finger
VSPHISTQRAEQYRHRALAESELLAVDDHLAACEECRQQISANVEVETLVSDFHQRLLATPGVPESDHVSYEQLVTLVDGELEKSEHDALQTHLEICEPCTQDLNDLRAFRAELHAVTAEEIARAPKPSLAEKIRSWKGSQRVLFRPAFAGALALLLIVASVASFLAWRAWRRSQPVLQATSPAPEASPEANYPNVAAGSSSSQESTPNEHFVVTLNDGGKRVTLDANGNIDGLAPLQDSSSRAVRRALTTGQVEVPDLSELIGVKGRLLGPANDGVAFSLISPVGIVTRSARPTFRWQPLAGATSYTVAILDDSYNVVTTSPPLTTTNWSPTVELNRGRIYSWQVTASKDGKQQVSPTAPEPESRFKVLHKATVDELSNAETSGNSHLVRGAMYARAGLLDDAERELRALLAANPNSEIAKKLLQSVQAKRRQ